jgi:hypothetical protein
MIESHNAVTPLGQRQVVRRNQRRQAMRTVQPFQQLKHGPSILLVQVSGRFICQQHLGPGDERPSDRNALLFPSRKLSGAVVGPILQAHFRQPLARLVPRNFLWLSAH